MPKQPLQELLNQVFQVCRGRRAGRRPGRAAGRKGTARRLAVELLEERCLLSTLQAISLPPNQTAAGDSFSTSVSKDGRYTVFTSTASNLVAGQVNRNTSQNVFLFDRTTGSITLVNHLPGLPATTGDGGIEEGNAFPVDSRPPRPFQPVISADGHFVAFASYDDDLVPGAAGAGGSALSVYLYDVATGQITSVDHDPASTPAVGLEGSNPVLSADGRYVAYTFAPSPGQYPSGGVALYDSVLHTTVVIPDSTTAAPGDPTISDDGTFVAYLSGGQAHVYDRGTGRGVLVSHDSSALASPANVSSSAPVISHDGSAIAFVSAATDLVPGQVASAFTNVFLYKNDTSGNDAVGTVLLVSGAGGSVTAGGDGNSDSPAVDGDGGYVAYRSDATDLVGGQVSGSNVYEFNTQTGNQTLVSAQAGSPNGAGGSSEPVIAEDGHLVAYVSTAGNLIPGQSGPAGVKNMFLWLRQTGVNLLISGQDGSPTLTGNADSDGPLLARDGLPGFSSRATNLLPGVVGTSVAYINTLGQVALVPIALGPSSRIFGLNVSLIPSGGCSLAGTVVGYLDLSSLLAGQFLPPVYSLPPAEYANALFTLQPAGASVPDLVFQASSASQASYLVSVHVNIGFGDNSFLLQVSVPPMTCPTDITALVPVARGATTKRGSGARQSLTLTYTGGSPLVGYVWVVLVGLRHKIHLLNRSDTISAYSKGGSPYVRVAAADFARGARVPVPLHFRDPGRRALRYSVVVLAAVEMR
jgi:Tol biopolymer transport system component